MSNKIKRINIRLTEKEYDFIAEHAKQANMTISRYCFTVLSGQPVIILPDFRESCHLYRMLGTNLNQLTILAHQGRISLINFDEFKNEMHKVFELNGEILMLGRKKLKNWAPCTGDADKTS